MTRDQELNDGLDQNIRRLFGRLEEKDPAHDATRDRILARLLQESAPSPTQRARPGWRRTIRWAGLAAGLLVGVGIVTDALIDSGSPTRVRAPHTASSAAVPAVRPPLVGFAIHLLAKGPGVGVVEAASAEDGRPVPIGEERYVSNEDVASARLEHAGSGCLVSIGLTDEGSGKLARLTRDHVGDQLALVIDGKVVMTPTIRSEIRDGQVQLTGDFTDARCAEIARGLSSRPQ